MNIRIDRRLSWIETALRTNGSFPREVYKETFGISTQTVSDDLNSFFEKMKELGVPCHRKYGGLSVDLPANSIFPQMDLRKWTEDVAPGTVLHVAAPRLAEPDEETVQTILRSVRDKVAIRCDYNSLSSGPRRAVLSPHTLVSAVGREHVRAFDHGKNTFQDYTLARMSNVVLAEDVPYADEEGDEEWNNTVSVTLRPVSGLSKKQRDALLVGLGAVDDEGVTFQCRKALVNYTIQSLGLAPEAYVDQIKVEVSS
jgi:hypothetical protein